MVSLLSRHSKKWCRKRIDELRVCKVMRQTKGRHVVTERQHVFVTRYEVGCVAVLVLTKVMLMGIIKSRFTE